jgi:signal transduction histidine kinase
VTNSADTIRAERFAEIGAVIRRDAGVIIQRWAARAAEEQPGAGRVHHEVLLDHLPDFLARMADTLAESGGPGPHRRAAADHAEQRWTAGWSVAEVVRDYRILRMVVLDYLDESLDRPLRLREAQAVGLTLDEAIESSVAQYARHREAQLEKLERALREEGRRKDEFLAILAHELRNPLAPVRNAIELLKLRGESDPDTDETYQVVDRQVRHLCRLVDDLSDVSRVSQGKLELRKERVEVASVLALAVEACRPMFDARRQVLEAAPAPGLWVEGDTVRLTQVVGNLLTNASKYSAAGTGRVTLAARPEGSQVVIRVADNGIGIAADVLPRVFDMYVQAEPALRHAQGGLGVGLTLVKRLAEMHGGTAEARSAGPGKGSEFVVRLPAVPAPAAAPGTAPPPVASPRRVLVVDDNVDAALSLAILMRAKGHEASPVHEGAAVLEAARSFRPDVVLLDIGLPGDLSGYDLAPLLRQEPGFAGVLLVALTGYGQDEDRRRAHEAGFDAFLTKPADLDALDVLLASARPV